MALGCHSCVIQNLFESFGNAYFISIDSFLSNSLTEETKHTQGEMVMYGSKAPQNGNENHASATVWCNS